MRSRIPKLLASVLLAALGGGVLTAAVMSGGLFQMVKSLVESGSGSSFVAGGAYTLTHSVAQPNVGTMSGGGYTLESGYQTGPLAAPTLITGWTVPSLADSEGIRLGVSTTSSLSFVFDQAMDTTSVLTAVSVSILKDRGGNAMDTPAATALSYDTATWTLTIAPASAWDGNTLYRVTIATTAASLLGAALAEQYVMKFRTIYDRGQDNAFADDSGAGTRLMAPALAFPENGYVTIKTDPLNHPDRIDPAVIKQANEKLARNLGGGKIPIAIRELNAYNGDSKSIEPESLQAALAVQYEVNAAGFVAETFPPVRPDSLSLWVLDEKAKLWLKVPGAHNDTRNHTVSITVPHLSVYALIGGQDTDVSQVYAFPVPWKPRSENSARYGTLAGGITFANLPSRGSIRIFTISGELAATLDIPYGATTVKWFGTNARGENVASGVYLWDVQSGGDRNSGKLMIVW